MYGTPYVGRHQNTNFYGEWSPFVGAPTPRTPKSRSRQLRDTSPLFSRTPDDRRVARQIINTYQQSPGQVVAWNMPTVGSDPGNYLEALTKILTCQDLSGNLANQTLSSANQNEIERIRAAVAKLYATSEKFMVLWNNHYLRFYATIGVDSTPRSFYGSAYLQKNFGIICYKNVLASLGEYINKSMNANLQHMSDFYAKLKQMGFEGSDLRDKIFYTKASSSNYNAAEIYKRGIKYLLNSGITADCSKKTLKFYKDERRRLQVKTNNLANAYEELKAEQSQLKQRQAEKLASVRGEIANMRDDRSQILNAHRNEKLQYKVELSKLNAQIRDLKKQKERDAKIVAQYKLRHTVDQNEKAELKEEKKDFKQKFIEAQREITKLKAQIKPKPKPKPKPRPRKRKAT